MLKATLFVGILLQTSLCLSLGRLGGENEARESGESPSPSPSPLPILTEQSYGINLARHQTPEYADEKVKSRDAQHSVMFSPDSGLGLGRSLPSLVDTDHCKEDKKCHGERRHPTNLYILIHY